MVDVMEQDLELSGKEYNLHLARLKYVAEMNSCHFCGHEELYVNPSTNVWVGGDHQHPIICKECRKYQIIDHLETDLPVPPGVSLEDLTEEDGYG